MVTTVPVCRDLVGMATIALVGHKQDSICSVHAYMYNRFTYAMHTDIDECLLESEVCGMHACANSNGSYDCNCNQGYTKVSETCQGKRGNNIIQETYIILHFNISDIDECSEESHDCAENAECDNTDGSYDCHCTIGYTGDGISCEGKYRHYHHIITCELT